MSKYELHQGDCLATLRGMADNSVDAVVTDPPYGLSQHKPEEVIECLRAWLAGEVYAPKGKGFMGKQWDAWVPGPEVWRECLRVLKPGGHVLAFAGTRSMDLMSMAIRLAGFELRDSIGHAHDGNGAPLMAYCFGSGFPKSHDVSKAIDREAGAEREVVGHRIKAGIGGSQTFAQDAWTQANRGPIELSITAPATEAARQWKGWGSALKPAWEPIILARKPLQGTLAANVQAHGTGGLNIDASRIPTGDILSFGSRELGDGIKYGKCKPTTDGVQHTQGRWPANLIHDGSAEVLAGFPANAGASAPVKGTEESRASMGRVTGMRERVPGAFHGDTGSAARFFYSAKVSKTERNEGMPEGVVNNHPTLKPVSLMAYLVRLVTPPGGVVLDPFAGSGSTLKAAILEGFNCIGIEREEEYLKIAQARCAHALHGMTGKDKQGFPKRSQPQPIQNCEKAEHGEQRCFDL